MSLPRPCDLLQQPPLTIDWLTNILQTFVEETGESVDLLLVGGLALQAYGFQDRATQDVDGELSGTLEPLVDFLVQHQVPADLGENISGWSVIAMPPGYRERASVLLEQPRIRLRLLEPHDFIIAKLRRGTDLDLDDASNVAHRFGITAQAVKETAESAIAASPKDTTLFLFRKIVDVFCQRLELASKGSPPRSSTD